MNIHLRKFSYLLNRRPGRYAKIQKNPAKYNFGSGQFYFDSEGSIKK